MGKNSLAQDGGLRKKENGGRGDGTSPPPAGAPPLSGEAKGCGIFTASELAELAGFDAALDAEEIFLTPEERRLSRELDRVARAEAETGDGGTSACGHRAGDGPHPSASPTPFRAREAPFGDAPAAASPGGKARTEGTEQTPETAEQRAARLEKKRLWREEHREQLRLSSARYNEAHRQERRDYQKAYDAAHKAEISARRRKKDAAGKQKEKEHG